ncbi:MAG: S9 family peptidase, partial [Acidimicrobiales bacterium]|nr:S9 family peptidase [Acidimicrobiales bacterium]
MATIREHLEARVAFPASWSSDGRRLLLGSNLPGTTQLYELDVASKTLTQLTDEDEPVAGRYLPVTDRVLVRRDLGGNERHQLFLLGQGGTLEGLVVDPEWMHVAGGASRDGQLLAYASNRRNGVDFDIYVRHLRTGDERCVYDRGGFCQAGGFSPDGSYLAVLRATDKSGDNELYLADVKTGELTHVTPHEDEAYASGPAWLPDGSGFFFSTDIGRDVTAIAFYDMAERRWDNVLEPGWACDCGVDWAGRHLVVVLNEGGSTRIELRHPKTLALTHEVPLPGRGVVPTWTLSTDGRHLAFQFTSPSVPGDVWCYDTDTAELTRLSTSPSAVDTSGWIEPEVHRIASFDGLPVPVFLYRPPQPPANAAVPVVVVVHGGPESQSQLTWNPVIGYLVEHGYAVAVPNVRGSTGYGKRYQHLDDRRRRLDSVADLGALHDWLGGQEGIDASRAALFGGSYGGYLVLAGLTFQPERWAAGVDIVGISSFVTFLENTSPYRRRVREREYGSLEADREFLVEASPLTHLERLRAPLFIVHGANDPRVPLSEAQQLHAALRDKGVASELLVYEDEGHGLQKLANRLDAYPKAVAFLDRV